jgi:transposase-like protein
LEEARAVVKERFKVEITVAGMSRCLKRLELARAAKPAAPSVRIVVASWAQARGGTPPGKNRGGQGVQIMDEYSDRIKEAMVMKLTSPGAPSANSLAAEVGIHQSTLSRWVREYANVGKAGGFMKARRPQDWTAEGKLNAVLEYDKFEEDDRGRYLREKGLHEVHIERWKQELIEGLKSSKLGRKDPRDKRIKELEKELWRKEKALAETAALLVLKKKAQAIWGDREDER